MLNECNWYEYIMFCITMKERLHGRNISIDDFV